MLEQTYHLELITPCFCAGANQEAAEIRAPSIRGKLRWWFRVLGGDRDQEAEAFGSTTGDSGAASAVIIRTSSEPKAQWAPIALRPNSNTGYLLYFAKASGNGIRWRNTGAVSQESSFLLRILWRRSVTEPVRELFDLALDCFLMLGSLGLRSTRGLGSFETTEKPFTLTAYESLLRRIKERQPTFVAHQATFKGPREAIIEALGAQLRGLRRGCSAGSPQNPVATPLGSSSPRQASAVHLRPIKLGPNEFGIIVFEAPAERVLGPDSRPRAPRLGRGLPAPEDPAQRRGSGGPHRR
jgi:CRISPR type III-B/RAMP module RAMP protein Cmr1